jgi:AmiR/NasT family two-component response regulator
VDRDADLLAEASSPEEMQVIVRRLLGVTEAAYERRAQLEQALRTRIVIEQAKGVLAERFTLDVEEAFELLRKAARSHRIKIHALAAEVVQSRETPHAIAEIRGNSA